MLLLLNPRNLRKKLTNLLLLNPNSLKNRLNKITIPSFRTLLSGISTEEGIGKRVYS